MALNQILLLTYLLTDDIRLMPFNSRCRFHILFGLLFSTVQYGPLLSCPAFSVDLFYSFTRGVMWL